MIPFLGPLDPFPPVATAQAEIGGLLAIGGDLSAARLLDAYRQGVFPWGTVERQPVWYSPDPRMVLFPDQLKISRSLARALRRANYEVRLDTAFGDIVRACAGTPREGQTGTWITPPMQAAYGELHRLGYAHSVETWVNGKIVGGLYGVAIGRAFYGESMFSHARDASKIALAHLCAHLKRRGFGIIDCQMETAHLASLGARQIPRHDFALRVESLCAQGDAPGPWPATAIADHFRRLP